MLLLSVDELKLFFGETSWTVILLSVSLLTPLSVLVNFLHGNYRDLKIKTSFAISKS